jgi:hypothetical protein
MQERARSTWDEIGPSQARVMMQTAQAQFERANAEREFAFIMCYFAHVPSREVGPIIHRDGSTAWERTKTILRKWRQDRLEWPADILARLDGLPVPPEPEPKQENEHQN